MWKTLPMPWPQNSRTDVYPYGWTYSSMILPIPEKGWPGWQ